MCVSFFTHFFRADVQATLLNALRGVASSTLTGWIQRPAESSCAPSIKVVEESQKCANFLGALQKSKAVACANGTVQKAFVRLPIAARLRSTKGSAARMVGRGCVQQKGAAAKCKHAGCASSTARLDSAGCPTAPHRRGSGEAIAASTVG